MNRDDKIALIDGDSLIYYEMGRPTLEEALEGIDNGYPISTIARWLMVEKQCPLSIHTLRHQLKDTHDVKSR